MLNEGVLVAELCVPLPVQMFVCSLHVALAFSKSSSFHDVVDDEPSFQRKNELTTPSPGANRMRASNRP